METTAIQVPIETRENLRKNGFVVLKSVIDPALLVKAEVKARETMAFYGDKLDKLEKDGELPYCLPMPVHDHIALLDHAEALLESIGTQPNSMWLQNLMLIMKKPHEGRRFWHTDCPPIFAPSDEDAPEVFVLYFLQKTTVKNGALLVVPGYAEGPQHSERVTTPMEGEYAIEVDPGDVIVFDPRLLHGSMPNDTDNYRFNVRLWIQTKWKDKQC